MAKFISILSMVIGTAGIFMAFDFLFTDPEKALRIVTFSTVGVTGILAFVRHVIFYKADMKRLGWETDRPDWMFEVGFANLGFGAAGLFSSMVTGGKPAMAVVLGAYALYLFQAGMLHGYRYFTDPVRSPARLWRSCVSTLLYAGMMGYFVITTL